MRKPMRSTRTVDVQIDSTAPHMVFNVSARSCCPEVHFAFCRLEPEPTHCEFTLPVHLAVELVEAIADALLQSGNGGAFKVTRDTRGTCPRCNGPLVDGDCEACAEVQRDLDNEEAPDDGKAD